MLSCTFEATLKDRALDYSHALLLHYTNLPFLCALLKKSESVCLQFYGIFKTLFAFLLLEKMKQRCLTFGMSTDMKSIQRPKKGEEYFLI